MPRPEPSHAPSGLNRSFDLFHFSIEVGRIVIMLDVAKDSLLNREAPRTEDAVTTSSPSWTHTSKCARLPAQGAR